jgi:hypothetical protein
MAQNLFLALPDEIVIKIFVYIPAQDLVRVKNFSRLGRVVLVDRVVERVVEHIAADACYDAIRLLIRLNSLPGATDPPPTGHLRVVREIRNTVARCLDTSDDLATNKVLQANDALRVLDQLLPNALDVPKPDAKSSMAIEMTKIQGMVARRLIEDIGKKQVTHIIIALDMLCQLQLSTKLSGLSHAEIAQPLCEMIIEQVEAGNFEITVLMLERLCNLQINLEAIKGCFLRIQESAEHQILQQLDRYELEGYHLQNLLQLLQCMPHAPKVYENILRAGQDKILHSMGHNWARAMSIIWFLQTLPHGSNIPEHHLTDYAKRLCDWLSEMVMRGIDPFDRVINNVLSYKSTIETLPHADVQKVVEAISSKALQHINGSPRHITVYLNMLKLLPTDSKPSLQDMDKLLSQCHTWAIEEVKKECRDCETIKIILEVLQSSATIDMKAVLDAIAEPDTYDVISLLPDKVRLQTHCKSLIDSVKKSLAEAVSALNFPYVQTLLRILNRVPEKVEASVHCELDITTPCLARVIQLIQNSELDEATRNMSALIYLPEESIRDEKMASFVWETLELRLEIVGITQQFPKMSHYEDRSILRHKFGNTGNKRWLGKLLIPQASY